MVLTTQERSEMYNRRFMRRRFNIPRTDEVTQRWYEAQVNPSQSLRLLVELFVEAYGETADVEYEAKMDDGFARLAKTINDRSGQTRFMVDELGNLQSDGHGIDIKIPQPQKTSKKKETPVSQEEPEIQEMSQKELDALAQSSQSELESESKDTDDDAVNLNLYDL